MTCNHEWGGVVIPGPVNRIVIDQCENCGELRLPDAPPAQAMDLDELRRAACAVGVVGQIDGHDVVRRNSVLDVIDNRLQRLIDSQAVRNG